jgi:hypothetical protein
VADNFRLSRKSRGPRWLVGDESDPNDDGVLVGYSLDVVKDAAVRRAELGLLARFPQQDPDGTPGPDDALAAIGRDRGILRGINETSAAYAVRLIRYLTGLQTKGNPYALMQQLQAYIGGGSSFRTVDNHSNWFSLSATGVKSALINNGTWNWDGNDPDTWARFWVIIYPGTTWEPLNAWGDAGLQWGTPNTTDGDVSWGSTATGGEVSSVRTIVRTWKPAGTRCINIIIAFDPASFNPASPEADGTWAQWSKTVNGVRVKARLATALYWDGTAR